MRVEGKGWERSFLVELKIRGLREAGKGRGLKSVFPFPLDS